MSFGSRLVPLALALALTLGGCAGAPGAPRLATLTRVGHLQVQGYRLAAAVAPYSLSDVTRLEVVLFDELGHELERRSLAGPISPIAPIMLAGLAPDRLYTVQLDAYASSTLLSLPALSRTPLDTRPTAGSTLDAHGVVEDQQGLSLALAFGDRPVTVTAHVRVDPGGKGVQHVVAHLGGLEGDTRTTELVLCEGPLSGAVTLPCDFKGLVPGARYRLTVDAQPYTPPSESVPPADPTAPPADSGASTTASPSASATSSPSPAPSASPPPTYRLFGLDGYEASVEFTARPLDDLLTGSKDDEMTLTPLAL